MNPVVVCIWVDWDDVHMTSEHQRFNVLGPLPFVHQRVGIHFCSFEVRMATKKRNIQCTRIEVVLHSHFGES